MTLWTLLDSGYSMPGRGTAGQRLSLWFGHLLATRHRQASIHPRAMLSPEARICPRQGRIEIGAETQIALGSLIQGNVRIGAHSSVQAYCNLVGYGRPDEPDGRIEIGNYVRIASHTVMIAANHNFEDVSIPIHRQGLAYAPITIQDDVWIGARVVIIAGITIGHGSVIGAGSVVTRNISPYSIAVGVPAHVIKTRGEG